MLLNYLADSAIALSLCAAVGWGTADFLAGNAARRAPLLVVMFVVQVAALAFVVLTVLTRGLGPVTPGGFVFGAVAGLAWAVGAAAFYKSLAIGVMSVTSPIVAQAAIVPVLLGLVAGAQPTPMQILGMTATMVGVAVVVGASGAGEKGTASRRSIQLALVAAAAVGTGLAAFEMGGETAPVLTLLVQRITTALLIGAAILVTGRAVAGGLDRTTSIQLVAAGLMDGVAAAAFVFASTQAYVGVAAVISSMHPVVTIMLARRILGERLRPIETVGLVGALCGVALLSLAQ